LAVAVSAGTLTNQAYVPPTGTGSFGTPGPMGTADGTWFTDLSSSKSWTYTIAAGDQGKNIYFRSTITNCSDQFSQTLSTEISGDDGTGTTFPPHSGTFSNKGSFSFVPDSNHNYSNIIGAGGDSSFKAGNKVWTFTLALTGNPSFGQTCSGFVDLITYGSVVSAGKIGANGNPGPTQDAWVPCCDSIDSAYVVSTTDQPHKYLEVSVQSSIGEWNYVKLTNPGSLIGLADVTNFPSSGKGIVTARTCLSNQSCEVIAANYMVHIVNDAIDAINGSPEDVHATFTLTTKAGVASASAAIAMFVAALFALFH